MHGLILIFIILIGGVHKVTVEKSKFGIAERDEDAVGNCPIWQRGPTEQIISLFEKKWYDYIFVYSIFYFLNFKYR